MFDMVCFVRYVFPDEASAEASADGRSADYVVARSEEEAAEQARGRCAVSCFTVVPFHLDASVQTQCLPQPACHCDQRHPLS